MSAAIAVVDASVWIDALVPGARTDSARTVIGEYSTIAAPEHLRLEVTNYLRRHARQDARAQASAQKAMEVLRELTMDIVPTAELMPRVWQLRQDLSAYDAAYLAAAESLGAHLLTRDQALLAHAARTSCVIRKPSG